MTPLRLAASLGGIGMARRAPGTWGSLAVLPLGLLAVEWRLLLAGLFAAVGWWVVRALLRRSHLADADPAWVVIDEAAGQMLALAALPAHPTGFGIALAFLLFRLFDIAKPGPVGWADRLHGATGVILDDLVAGAIAGALLLGYGLLLPPQDPPAFFHLGVLR
ncbi:phosphatidylglycerophosphatase A [Roseomonas sp. NAR14]|uniref:Phosphatidylglycerophosphatase A n=1 Tax=Roseomonas acroporae TaxID=2937791 RepID=A0A9X1Y506_9PROT|nr:phosphatidylglycerophosphatase A [Roseomonas acroporae]